MATNHCRKRKAVELDTTPTFECCLFYVVLSRYLTVPEIAALSATNSKILNFVRGEDHLWEPIVKRKFQFTECFDYDLSEADYERTKEGFPEHIIYMPARKHGHRLPFNTSERAFNIFLPSADDDLAINHPSGPVVLVGGTDYLKGKIILDQKTGAPQDLFYRAHVFDVSQQPLLHNSLYIERPLPIECQTCNLKFMTYKEFWTHVHTHDHIRKQRIQDLCTFNDKEEYKEEYEKLADPRYYNTFYELPQFYRAKALFDHVKIVCKHVRELPIDEEAIKVMRDLIKIYREEFERPEGYPEEPTVEQMHQTCINYITDDVFYFIG